MTRRALVPPRRDRRTSTSTPRAALLLLVATSAGCSESAEAPSTQTGPLYALSVTDFSQGFDFAPALIMTVPSLADGVADPGTGIESEGELRLWPGASPGAAFALIGEQALIARYELDDAGRLEVTGRLGLSGVGVTTFDNAEVIRVVSENKAYLLSSATWTAIEFDPSALTITDTLDLGALADDVPGYFAWDSRGLRGDELVALAYYLDFDADIVGPSTRAVFIDTRTNELTIAEHPSCGGIGYIAWSDSGDLLGTPEPWCTATYRLRGGPAPCAVRIAAGERAFDTSFSMPALDTPPSLHGGIVPGPDGSVYVRVLDETLAAVSEDSQVAEIYSQPAWRTVRVSADFETMEEVGELAPTTGGLTWFEVEGKVYVNDSTEDFSTSTLIEMTGASGPEPGLEVQGVPFGIVRMR